MGTISIATLKSTAMPLAHTAAAVIVTNPAQHWIFLVVARHRAMLAPLCARARDPARVAHVARPRHRRQEGLH
jgi:hypothetical protein